MQNREYVRRLVMKKIILLLLLSASCVIPRTFIYMRIDSDVEFDLSLNLYPPLTFPTYYYPTSASPVNRQGIRLRFGYQRRPPGGHAISTLYLMTRGSSDFSSTVHLDQLYYAPDGEPLPSPGSDPPGGNWRAYSTLFHEIEHFTVSGVHGFFDRFQDYAFQSEVDDEPTNSSVVIYYRMFGL
jgi:hypothetical protein